MKPTATTILLLMLLCISANVSAASDEEPKPFTLFSFLSEEKQDLDDVLFFYENRDAITRAAEVLFSEELKSAGAIAQGDLIVVNLFGDIRRSAVVQRAKTNVSGSFSITATINEEEGYLVFATSGKRSLGSVFLPQRGLFYEVISNPITLQHYLLEMDEQDRDIIEGAMPAVKQEIPGKRAPDTLQNYNIPHREAPLAEEEAIVDVMVVYTPAAMAWGDFHGGGIDNIIAVSMANAQLVHDNSHTRVRLPLSYSALIDYEETGNSQIDLWRLITTPTYNPFGTSAWGGYDILGYMDEVHDMRNEHNADLCVLFSYTHDTGGMAHPLISRYGQPKLGFSIVRVQQAASSYTQAHEMGHNMGCHHHKDQKTQPGPTAWTNWPENRWSAGWRWQSDDGRYYCSVMTYESGHFFDDGISHTRVPLFSSPENIHMGTPAGHQTDGDNVRTILETRHVVANYRVPGMALVSTSQVSDIWLFSAVSGGTVNACEDHPVTQRGLVWDTVPYPTLERHSGLTKEGSGGGYFYSQINMLDHSTDYYVAAYAKNEVGTAYGAQRFFQTLQPLIAHVSTTKAHVTGHNAAVAGGHVTNGGNSEVYRRGTVWGTRLNPTIEEHDGMSLDGSGTGVFESNMHGLRPGTRYFYRAYASNQAGTTYGVMHALTTPVASIFPNPFVDKLHVAFFNESHKDVHIILKNAQGQKVKQKHVNQYGDVHKLINLHHLDKGLYVLSIESEQTFPVWRLIKADH